MLVENPDEKELLVKLRQGDEHAFDKLYHMYSLRIYRKLLKMVKIDILADELTQEVFVKIWTRRHQIDSDQSFRSYLFSIAKNLVYDNYRKISRDDLLADQIKMISTEFYTHTEEAIYYKQTGEMIQKAIDLLPPQQKRVFQACKIEGRSYIDVAQEMNISTSTVNNHIVKATKSVAEYLKKSGALVLLMLFSSTFLD
jgi:RNA polymerase sigma-70 factor (ECF subfamily)